MNATFRITTADGALRALVRDDFGAFEMILSDPCQRIRWG